MICIVEKKKIVLMFLFFFATISVYFIEIQNSMASAQGHLLGGAPFNPPSEAVDSQTGRLKQILASRWANFTVEGSSFWEFCSINEKVFYHYSELGAYSDIRASGFCDRPSPFTILKMCEAVLLPQKFLRSISFDLVSVSDTSIDLEIVTRSRRLVSGLRSIEERVGTNSLTAHFKCYLSEAAPSWNCNCNCTEQCPSTLRQKMENIVEEAIKDAGF
ncbi:MAG: hypothetical protein HQK53_14935 [Oligoflexia bacterium]|nr:hypothetical protein [Oligoflexia bacterium]